MKKIILYIWCLPQNLLGLVVSLFLKKYYHGKHETAKVYFSFSEWRNCNYYD